MNTGLVTQLKKKFEELYGRPPGSVCFAPGRVNLLGEHTDYNGGHVFPCALTMGIYGAIAKRSDSLIRMHSMDLEDDGTISVDIRELHPGRTALWSRYPEGVFYYMLQDGHEIAGGADLLFAGDLPSGSGLSSSAALEVLTGLLLKKAYSLTGVSATDLALTGQKAENGYCGMHCGIMDQFSSAMGRKGHAIYLNTGTLAFKLVPLQIAGAEIIITNSRVKHSLVSSAYNDRRRECAEAVDALKKQPELSDLRFLCELTAGEFEQYAGRIKDLTVRKRARHAVYENQRTVRASEVLRENDIAAFGRLMNESHISLRDDYEVSCEEIDFLVGAAWAHPGVIGSRITGGGFGGCTVSIVKEDASEDFIRKTKEKYFERYGLEAAFYRVLPGDGAMELS